jgi:soluble lytic murein transglycosylase-like protein
VLRFLLIAIFVQAVGQAQVGQAQVGQAQVGQAQGMATPASDKAVPSFEESVRAAMAPGLEKQRASIRKQAASSEEGFFALSWPVLPVMPGNPEICDPVAPEQLASLVEQAAQRESIQADLIHAVIKKESGGRACAVSLKGALGLMQLMPETAQELGVSDVFDPKQNIDAGVKLLKTLLGRYSGNLSLALEAYIGGIDRVDKENAIPQIPETVNYVSDILEELTKKKP